MILFRRLLSRRTWVAFALPFAACLLLGAVFGIVSPAVAAPSPKPEPQTGGYAGPESCGSCHSEIHETWSATRHAQAFSSPIFQQDWQELDSSFTCLECHTTGYDAASSSYAYEGVTCESCHGPFQTGHPEVRMPVTPDADLCADCHKTTTDEWRASTHGQMNIVCEACHNPHSQSPKAESVTDLCSNCHHDYGESFTHGTHSDAGLECSNCHMFTSPRINDPIEGLVPTGHTFFVGSDACIGCHQDTVHTRNVILELRGEATEQSETDPETLRQVVQDQEDTIANLEAVSTVRLYTGLAQGAIVGLATGGVVAWIVSQRVRVIDTEGDQDEQEEES
jgi:predicted CXXCH cytochrome family protein